MKLIFRKIERWPKLAWAAVCRANTGEVVVYHGPCVELSEQWCAEAVWAGEYSDGDFDKTELVFGTGIRCRGNQVVFVSSGTMMDRLWCREEAGKHYLSNSLPALLACSGRSLSEDYRGYSADMNTMRQGLWTYCDTIPADEGVFQIAYYHNFQYDGRHLTKIDKPDTAPEFTCYAEYHDYLRNVAKRLQRNYQASERKYAISPLATVSAGYDSCAAAKLARDAGCRETVTIVNASSFFPRSDSGSAVAECLGIRCRDYYHRPRHYKEELSVWAAAGEPGGLNLTIFDYPEPLCLFYTAYRGDSLRPREILNRTEPFAVNTIEGLGLCEYRLIQGIFHCPVPFWGCRKAEAIQAITFSAEMEPWTLHTNYDRPFRGGAWRRRAYPATVLESARRPPLPTDRFRGPFCGIAG